MRVTMSETLTIEDIETDVAAIQAAADEGDDEKAHSLENSLFENVLRAIADGSVEDPEDVAQAALASCDIDFARRCA